MIHVSVLAGLLCVSAVPALAGGDRAAVATVEQYLRDDEKPMLAAVLADKAAAAEFNADVKFAGSDAKVMKLVLDKWRGRVVAYAETDSKIATPDVEGTYANYGAMLSARTKAYLVRLLKMLNEPDLSRLRDPLTDINSALASNDGKLTWYTKRVVPGIFDEYRKALANYLPTPIAQGAKAAAPAATQTLADRRKAAEAPPVVVASAKPPVRKDPGVEPPASTDALEQARRAAEAAERSGGVFDGGAPKLPADGSSVAGLEGAGAPPLPPSSGGDKPDLIADVSSPEDSDDEFLNSINKMPGNGPLHLRQYLPSGIGALLGGVLGFYLGGPIGILIGAGLGVIVGKKLFK
jgi:hypothetical protein